jgi:hypothetical protein
MERYVTVSFCGVECRSFENRIAAPEGDTMTIDLGDTLEDSAVIQVVRYEDGEYRERKIVMADLRAFLEDRDAAAKWMHNADDLRTRQADSRLGQSAQIEEVK